jgi:hypothetical protein
MQKILIANDGSEGAFKNQQREAVARPSALNDLARAFDSAWKELRAQGVEMNSEEQLRRIRTKLAQRIMEYATEGEHGVGHLKEFGLQGLPYLCVHGVRLPKRSRCRFLS